MDGAEEALPDGQTKSQNIVKPESYAYTMELVYDEKTNKPTVRHISKTSTYLDGTKITGTSYTVFFEGEEYYFHNFDLPEYKPNNTTTNFDDFLEAGGSAEQFKKAFTSDTEYYAEIGNMILEEYTLALGSIRSDQSVAFSRNIVGRNINNMTKQNEHISGTAAYLNRIRVTNKIPSVLTEDPNALLRDFHNGLGSIVSNNPAHKSVIVKFTKPIGDVIEPNTGRTILSGTYYGAIKYGSNTHITPVNWDPKTLQIVPTPEQVKEKAKFDFINSGSGNINKW